MTMSSTAAGTDRSRNAVRGAFIGFLVDNFDIYLPLVALGPAIIYFIPASLNIETAALVASWVFVATLVGRPLGSLAFGLLADRIGRRRSTLIAVAGFGVITLLIACLPGYATWGMGGVIALTVLRFIGGVFLGGEYSGANVLAMEESPRERRGINGGVVQTGGTVAYVLLTLITLGLLAIIPNGTLDSAYNQWGWRIPFVIGAALAFAFLVYYSHEVKESSVWIKSESVQPVGTRTPRPALTATDVRNFMQVFLMMTGMWFLLNSITAMMPPILRTTLKLSSSGVTLIAMAIFTALTVVYVLGGALSQRIGRRTYLMGASALSLVGGLLSFAALVSLDGPSLWTALLLAVLAGVCIVSPWAVVTSYLAERFKTANRAVGFGLGYSLAVIIPSFYATYQGWLTGLMPREYTVLVLVGLGSVLAGVGAAIGPETKGIDFHAEPEVATTAPAARDLHSAVTQPTN